MSLTLSISRPSSCPECCDCCTKGWSWSSCTLTKMAVSCTQSETVVVLADIQTLMWTFMCMQDLCCSLSYCFLAGLRARGGRTSRTLDHKAMGPSWASLPASSPSATATQVRLSMHNAVCAPWYRNVFAAKHCFYLAMLWYHMFGKIVEIRALLIDHFKRKSNNAS